MVLAVVVLAQLAKMAGTRPAAVAMVWTLIRLGLLLLVPGRIQDISLAAVEVLRTPQVALSGLAG